MCSVLSKGRCQCIAVAGRHRLPQGRIARLWLACSCCIARRCTAFGVVSGLAVSSLAFVRAGLQTHLLAALLLLLPSSRHFGLVCQLLGQERLCHGIGNLLHPKQCAFVPLCSCKAKQPPRLFLVLWPAMPVGMQNAEVVLRSSMPLRSREAKQPPCLHLVFRYVNPSAVNVPEAVLRMRIPLHSGEAEQPPRLSLILWAAMPLNEHDREMVLRSSMPLRSREAIQPPCLSLVLWSATPVDVHGREVVLRMTM